MPLFSLRRHATDAVYGGNDRRLGAPWFVSWQPGFGVDLRPYRAAKNLHLQFYADYARFVLAIFATTPEHLIGLRILIGIGLGGDYSVGHTLLAEFSPRRHRGILLGAFSVVWTVGYVLASIAGHHFISESPEAWRWLLASAALPALLITLLRWARRNRHAGYCARGVLQKLTLSFIAILARMFYWAMKWQRRPINTSKPCSLRATGGAQRLTASSLSAS